MKRMLEDDNIDLENKKSQENKKDKNQLYNDKLANDFSNYTKEEISKVLDYISENRRNVFILYYGIDSNKSFSYKEIMKKLNITYKNTTQSFYNAKKAVISNLSVVVKNETIVTKDKNKKIVPDKIYVDEENTTVYKDRDEQNNITPIYKDADKEVEIKFIPKEFNIPALSSFSENKENFRVLINLLSNPTQQVILLLSLGYVEDKCYSVDEISKLLGFEKEKVIEIISDGLSNRIYFFNFKWCRKCEKTVKNKVLIK